MKCSQIQLRAGDRRFLEDFRGKGQHSAREVTRAHILLASEARVPTSEIQRVLGVSRMVVWRTRSAYCEKGLDYALYDAARPGQPAKYGTDQEAEVVALACSQPPEGAGRWTIRSLTIAARHRPRLEGVNRESIRQMLKRRLQTLAENDVVHRAHHRRIPGADLRSVETGVPLHPKPRQLAEHGRDRDWNIGSPIAGDAPHSVARQGARQ